MKLGTKLTIAFGAMTLLPLAPLTLVAREVIGNRYRQELRRQLDEAAQQTEHDYDAAQALLERTATWLATPSDAFARIVALATTPPTTDEARGALSELAAQEARTRGLDVLVVDDANGRVIAAPADPGSEGQRDLVRRTLGRAQIVEEHPRFVRQGPGRLAVEVTRQLGGTRITVGSWLDEILPERMGPSLERVVRPQTPAPGTDLVQRVELDSGDGVVPVEIRALDTTLQGLLRELSLAVALLALGGVALSMVAGSQVARRITRPLDDLATNADRVAQGARDVKVLVRAKDEVGALTARFNEMVRALGEAEQNARRAERAAAWRQMAQHLAHELKNPLTPIQMSIETLQRVRARPERAADFDKLFDESAKVILDEVTRLKSIVAEFSRFARLPALVIADVDINELCEAAAKLYEGSITIERQLTPALPPARGDRDQLQQVLVNLLENAREASPGGRVKLRTARADGHVLFAVLDDGPGIADDVQLFTPYATNKPGGTGLGLALVQRIVTEHGGRIEVVSGLPREAGGHGAGFEILLPASDRD